MMNQFDKAARLGCSQTTISITFSGERPVSWPLAKKLYDLFKKLYPDRDIEAWKKATPEQLDGAFELLEQFETEDAA